MFCVRLPLFYTNILAIAGSTLVICSKIRNAGTAGVQGAMTHTPCPLSHMCRDAIFQKSALLLFRQNMLKYELNC